jgi:CRP-like cAMP-binding protein
MGTWYHCRPGAYFGELALLHGKRRAATIVASTDTSLLTLARDDFAELLVPLQAKLEQQAADYAPLPAKQQSPSQPKVTPILRWLFFQQSRVRLAHGRAGCRVFTCFAGTCKA